MLPMDKPRQCPDSFNPEGILRRMEKAASG